MEFRRVLFRSHCFIGKKQLRINANEYLIVPQGREHVYWASEEQPWTIYWAHFKGKLADHLSELLYGRLLRQRNTIQYNESQITLLRNIYQVLQLGYQLGRASRRERVCQN